MSPQATAAAQAAAFVAKLNAIILFPLIALLSGVALLVFIIGCAQYIMSADNPSGREQGVKHITYGIIGLVIMMSAWAILALVAGTFGLTTQLDCAANPQGCSSAFTLPTFSS
jgi:hypothetical protein